MVSLGRVTRPAVRRAAACLLTGLAAALAPLLAAGGTAHADQSTGRAPLEVSIGTLSPATVPSRGNVTVSGIVTNRSSEPWTDLQAYLFTSSTPMTTAEELASASHTDAVAVVGSRVIGTGLSEQLGDLEPGQSEGYTLSVPRRYLGIPRTPGVYWIGVHVLGKDSVGQDNVADGRARTFIPVASGRTPRTSLALVMPVQSDVRRGADGRLLHVAAWERSLAPDGRLDRLLALSSTAGRPLTWLTDPAVLDAVRSVAGGNPVTSTEPTTGGGSAGPSPSPSASPASPSASPSGGPTGGGSPTTSAQRNAGRWLADFRQQSTLHAVLAVPYGALDVASAYRRGYPGLVASADSLSARTLDTARVSADLVTAPASGFLPATALARLPADQPVLLSDAAFPTASGTVLSRQRGTRSGPPVVLSDTRAGSGGPGPGRRFDALAVRQRILSEAALHALSPARDQALVVQTPRRWDPGADWRESDFFGSLDQPWLDLVDVPTLLASTPATRTPAKVPVYPRRQRAAEVPAANLQASARLRWAAAKLGTLLDRNDAVQPQVAKLAALGSSTTVRAHPGPALRRLRAGTRWAQHLMRQVQIEGPPFVILSSDSGTFQVTIINKLDAAVKVGVRAFTGGRELRIDDGPPVALGPGQRASVRLRATATGIGVHAVTLMPVTTLGQPLGRSVEFNVRSSQVGLVIWAIMGIGGAVLFIAIAIRVSRRVARRKKTHGPVLKGVRR